MDGILSDPKKWNDAVQNCVQENFQAEETTPSAPEATELLQFGQIKAMPATAEQAKNTKPAQTVFGGESSDSAGLNKPNESYQVRSDLIDAASLMKRQNSHGQS